MIVTLNNRKLVVVCNDESIIESIDFSTSNRLKRTTTIDIFGTMSLKFFNRRHWKKFKTMYDDEVRWIKFKKRYEARELEETFSWVKAINQELK